MKLALLLLAGWLTIPAFGGPVYVSPTGDDQAPGTLARPLATLAAAVATGAESIQVRAGTYELESPLVVTNSIEAYQGERVVISGGRQITGWKKVAGRPGYWHTLVPEVARGEQVFRQLFIDGKRKTRARSPNKGFFRIDGVSPQDKPARLKFRGEEVQKIWETYEDVEAVALLGWAPLRMQIRKVNAETKTAILSGNPRPSNREDNARYFIENAPEALDAPGEWYLNAQNGRLTYYAEPGEDLTRAEVIAPRLGHLLQVSGSNVVLRGLTFSFTDWDMPKEGLADTQAAIGIKGDVRLLNAENCRVEDCTFSHLGGYALEVGAGCRNVEVIGNRMFDLGAGGIRIGTTAVTNVTTGNTIANNLIRHGGQVFPSGVGILVLQSGNNRIANNHIHHLYYTGISVGWTWGYRESPCRSNIIEFNHLHDIGQGMLSDMGGVYLLGPQPGTVVRNNLIHDVNASTYGGWGMYTDEGSSYITLENNIVYRCKSALFHQHYGRENIVRNNILAFGTEHQMMRTREESHLSFIFTNNIVLFNSGQLLGTAWSNNCFVMDHNVYWSSGKALKFTDMDFDKWRERGHDKHSLHQDPLFVAPEKGNFRLRGGSPALQHGFKPIDMSRFGIEKRYR